MPSSVLLTADDDDNEDDDYDYYYDLDYQRINHKLAKV